MISLLSGNFYRRAAEKNFATLLDSLCASASRRL